MLGPEITVSVNGLQIVLTLAGNVLVCLAFYRVRSLRTPANSFLVSLSIADLFFVVVFVLNIVRTTAPDAPLAMCAFQRQLYHALNFIVLLSLAVISIDRLVAIKFSLRYVELVTKRRAVIVIAFVWFTGVALAILPIILKLSKHDDGDNFRDLLFGKQPCNNSSSLTPRKRGERKMENGKWRPQARSFFVRVFPVLLPYVILFVCYTWIFYVSWRHYKRVKRQQEVFCPERKLHMKFAKTAAIVMGSFVALFTPLLVLALMKMHYKGKNIKFPYLKIANLIASNSAWLNPPIYAWRIKVFRKAFRKILRPVYLRLCSGCSPQNESNSIPRI